MKWVHKIMLHLAIRLAYSRLRFLRSSIAKHPDVLQFRESFAECSKDLDIYLDEYEREFT